jgi:hypothetical protein
MPTLKANLRRVQKQEVAFKQEKPRVPREVVIEHTGLDASAAHFDARIG